MIEDLKFGELTAQELSIGDIVEWSTWNSKKDAWDMNYGIITSIRNEIKSNRLISVSKVLPLSNTYQELEFFTLSLKLVSPSKKEKLTNEIKN